MDAISKTNFINSVVTGTAIPCPKCGMTNESDSKFCISCGTDLSSPQTHQANEPVFEQVKEAESSAHIYQYVEPNNVFAEGLPEWNIEPPQVMVRRR